jgi:mono/diheme cytochrome c family protein
MRRFAVLAATVLSGAALAAGCGYEGQTGATPETVEGSVAQPTSTETTSTETTSTETTSTETTSTATSPTPPGPPPPAQGDPAAGKTVFVTNCGGCHTLSDAGTSGTVGPNLDDTKPPYDLVVDRVTNGKSPMPPFKGVLTDQQIQDVAAYVSSAAGS